MHLSARESVELLRARAGARACRRPREVTPHHLCLTDEAVRSLDPNLKMNPPRPRRGRPARADRRAPRRHDRGGRDRPRAALARGEGRAVRGGAVRRHRPRDGVRGAVHAPRRAGRCSRSRRCSSGCRPARRGSSASTARGSPSARRRTSSSSTRRRRWRVREDRFRSRSANSWLLGRRLRGKVVADDRGGAGRVRGMSGFLVLEDGTVFSRRERRRPGYGVRRGRVHDRDDRLPGGRHRPELLRRRSSASRRRWSATTASPRRAPSRRGRTRAAVVMREARGPEWTDWLHEHGVPGADRDRHALARPAPARPRRDARGGRLRRRRRRRGAARRPRAAVDERRGARRPRLDARAVRRQRGGLAARRGRRLRRQALDPPPARRRRRVA